MARGLQSRPKHGPWNGKMPKKLSKEEKQERNRRANAEALYNGLFWHHVFMCCRIGTFSVGVALLWSGTVSLYHYMF
jgi:hypothetical protein